MISSSSSPQLAPAARSAFVLALVGCTATVVAANAQSLPISDDAPFAAAILVEAETGTTLLDYNSQLPRSPASTQKLLLQLVVLDAVAEGRLSLQDSVYTSAWASRIGGSQVYLKQGEVFTLGELMESIAIASANDACVAVAEHFAGTSEEFVRSMNDKAEQLGCRQTRCVNVHGLDDTPTNGGNRTSAFDLALVARALLVHPEALTWSSIRYKPFRDGKFMLYTTNMLLGKLRGLDGLKTGYTLRAGSCLVATAKRRDMRLISVILGAKSERQRDNETKRLLNWGFYNFEKVPIAKAGEHLGEVPLDWGLQPQVKAAVADTVLAVLSTRQRRLLTQQVELPELFPAPVEAGDSLGTVDISLGDSLLAQVTLVADESVGRMSYWEKLLSYF